MILANESVSIKRCPPGPMPEGGDGLDDHQFQGWVGLHGTSWECDENQRGAGVDPFRPGRGAQ